MNDAHSMALLCVCKIVKALYVLRLLRSVHNIPVIILS